MRKLIALMILFAGSMVFYGCPAQLATAIDNGSYTIPTTMTGIWEQKTAGGKVEKYDLTVSKYLKGHMTARKLNDSMKIVPGESHDIVVSDIDGQPFASIYDPGDGDESGPGFYIYKLNIVSPKEMILRGVKDGKIKYYDNSQDVIKFLKANQKDPSIYDDKEIMNFKKVGD